MTVDLFTFNQFFVQFKAPNADELTSYVLNKSEEYIEFSWAAGCQLKTISCSAQEIGKLIEPSVDLFSERLGKPFRFNLSNPWINCYERGSYQDIHDHIESDFSSVFFPQEQEDDFGKFYFYDRYGNSLSPKWKKLFGLYDRWTPNISPGDIIFFPSNVLHGVSIHKSEKTRKSFSCNYSFTSSEK